MDAEEKYATLTISAYVDQAAKTDRGVDNQSLAFPLLGLFGETGSFVIQDGAAPSAFAN